MKVYIIHLKAILGDLRAIHDYLIPLEGRQAGKLSEMTMKNHNFLAFVDNFSMLCLLLAYMLYMLCASGSRIIKGLMALYRREM